MMSLPDHLTLFDIAVNRLSLWDDQIKERNFLMPAYRALKIRIVFYRNSTYAIIDDS